MGQFNGERVKKKHSTHDLNLPDRAHRAPRGPADRRPPRRGGRGHGRLGVHLQVRPPLSPRHRAQRVQGEEAAGEYQSMNNRVPILRYHRSFSECHLTPYWLNQLIAQGWKVNSTSFPTIQFNSLFHFTQSNTIYTDFQVIYGINKLYKMSCCFHLIIHDIIFGNMHVLWK